MTDIFEDLRWRGLIHQTTADEMLPRWLQEGTRTVYAGFDPTADSLHVGSLLPLMMLRRFQKAGHRPIAIVGGATGMIGDPSGKSAERNLLSADQLEKNLAGIEVQMRQLLEFETGPTAAILVNNNDWMSQFSYIEFLRDVGKNFPVNVMLAKDSVKSRLGSDAGLSYTEFSYMLLQAYDFVHLNREYNCELQIGGSDQWGNVTAGIDLGRRMLSKQLFGMTCPLLTKTDGTKMGKTESGAIWLSSERTSPYEFYQYWYNVADEDAGMCLRFLTELSHEEIEMLDAARQSAPQKRESQTRLAEELTTLIHGEEGLSKARQAKEVFFGAEIETLADADLTQIFADVPQQKDVEGVAIGRGAADY
jgi:tyrosyl-tRNA synthetase